MRFYHGTTIELEIGQELLAPNVTGVIQEEGRKKNLDKVFFTSSFNSAKVYAGRAKNRFGGSGRIYEIEAIGEVTCLNSNAGTEVYFAQSAKIVAIHNL